MKGSPTFFEIFKGICKVIALFLGLIFSIGYIHTFSGSPAMLNLLALSWIFALIWCGSKIETETPQKKKRKSRTNSRRYYPSSYTYDAPYEDNI